MKPKFLFPVTCIVGASQISLGSVNLAVENASYCPGGGHSPYDSVCLGLRDHSCGMEGIGYMSPMCSWHRLPVARSHCRAGVNPPSCLYKVCQMGGRWAGGGAESLLVWVHGSAPLCGFSCNELQTT